MESTKLLNYYQKNYVLLEWEKLRNRILNYISCIKYKKEDDSGFDSRYIWLFDNYANHEFNNPDSTVWKPHEWSPVLTELKRVFLANSNYIAQDCGCPHFRSLHLEDRIGNKLNTNIQKDGVKLRMSMLSKFNPIMHLDGYDYELSQTRSSWRNVGGSWIPMDNVYYIKFKNKANSLRAVMQTIRRQRINRYSLFSRLPKELIECICLKFCMLEPLMKEVYQRGLHNTKGRRRYKLDSLDGVGTNP